MSKLLCSTKTNKILRQFSPNISLTSPTAAYPCPPPTTTHNKLSTRNITKCNFSNLRFLSNSLIAAKTTTTKAYSTIAINKHRIHYSTNNFHEKMSENTKRTFTRLLTPVTDAPANVFWGSVDRFNGITVESKVEFDPNIDFVTKLQDSLDYWIKIKRRAIWFQIQTEHSEWIPLLAKCDFDFHHARTGHLVMYRWLPQGEYPNLPVYAHTMLGVAGLVINEKNEILVVSEKNPIVANSWKLPGGYCDPSEDMIDAAIREVKEETGIDSKFRTLVSIRHAHGGLFGTSDLYVVFGLTPLTSKLTRCEREIENLQWMPVKEFLQHPDVHQLNRQFVLTYLDYQKRNVRITCQKGTHEILKKNYCLYFGEEVKDKQEKKDEQDSKDVGPHYDSSII